MSFVEMLPTIGALVTVVVVILWAATRTGATKLRKEVMFLRPRDKRGEKLDITRETDRSVSCEKTDPVHRFIKVGPAYVFKDGARTLVRFFGVEGSAYTAQLKDEKEVKVSTADYLKTLWGQKIYDNLPTKMRELVEDDKIGVTIEPHKINAEDEGLEKLSSDDVNDEADAIITNRLAKLGSTENVKQKLLGNLVWLGLGAGLYAILQNLIGAMT